MPALNGPAMHYRLAYAEPLRRLTYAESRWAAPPAELLQAFLERRFFAFPDADASGNGCRLELVIDEFEQRFEGQDVPRPPHWSGFRVVPDMIEFWYGAEYRLHDRLRYQCIDGEWGKRALYP